MLYLKYQPKKYPETLFWQIILKIATNYSELMQRLVIHDARLHSSLLLRPISCCRLPLHKVSHPHHHYQYYSSPISSMMIHHHHQYLHHHHQHYYYHQHHGGKGRGNVREIRFFKNQRCLTNSCYVLNPYFTHNMNTILQKTSTFWSFYVWPKDFRNSLSLS